MSVYLVSSKNINSIVSAAVMANALPRSPGGSSELSATDTGLLIWRANLKSMRARYPQLRKDRGMGKMVNSYHHCRQTMWNTQPIETIKLVHCLMYQSCEYDAWNRSVARMFLLELISSETRKINGYEDAKWGV